MGNLVHQSIPVAAPKTETATGDKSSAPTNTTVATAAASARALPPAFRAIILPILDGSKPEPPPADFEYDIYNVRQDDGKVAIAAARETLREAGKNGLVTAFDSANAAFMADIILFSKISEDFIDLRNGGDLAYNQRDIVIQYANTSIVGKRRLRSHKVVAEWLERYIVPYVRGGEVHAHAAEIAGLDPFTKIQEIGKMEIGKPRIRAIKGLMRLIQTGRLGATSSKAPAGPEAAAPVTTGGAAETSESEAQVATEAQTEAARALAEEIKAALPKRRRGAIPQETFVELQRKIQNAPVEVRDILYADKEVMDGLADLGTGKQALALMRSLDSVEGIFDECVRHRQQRAAGGPRQDEPKAREPFALMRQFLLRRPGTDEGAREQRNRLILHTRLNTEFIERLGDDKTRLIYRIVVRGTEELTAVDKVHEAAKTGNGAMAAQALMELATSDPTAMSSLEMDPIFRNSIAKMTAEVDVDGVPVRPYHLCLRLWGRRVGDSYDPAQAGKPVQESHEDDRPLNIAEKKRLQDQLYRPYAKRLRNELDDWVVHDSVINSALNSFERARNAARLVPLIRRAKEPPGRVLSQTYESMYGRNLRSDIHQGCSTNARRNAQRILDIRVDAASMGRIEGEAKLADERVEAKDKYTLDQALGEVMVGSKTVSKHFQDEAKKIKSEFDEWSSADLDDLQAVGRRVRSMWSQAAPELKKLTGLEHIHWSELLSNAFSAIGGSLKAGIRRYYSGKTRLPAALRAVGLDPNTVDGLARQRAEAETKAAAAASAPDTREAGEQTYASTAQSLFSALATLSRRSTSDELREAATLKASYVTQDPLARPARPTQGEGAAATPEPAADRDYSSPGGFYRAKFGVSPDMHVERVARGLVPAKPKEGDRTASDIATIFGLDPGFHSAAITNTVDEDGPLTITPEQRLLLRPGFTEGTAQNHARAIWQLLHKGGEIHLISSVLYGPFNDEEQKLIRIAFRGYSGGIDFQFYLHQAMEMRKNRAHGGGIVFSKMRMEGTAQGEAAVKDIQLKFNAQQRGARRGDIVVDADDSELMTALTVAAEGEIDNTARLRASAMNGDTDLIFQHVEGLSKADRKRIIADEQLMELLERQTGGADWDRVHAVLMGDADLVHRLEARTSWGTDEEGMRKDVKAYIARRRQKHEADVRDEAKQMGMVPEPAAMVKKVTDRVRADCAHLLANADVAGVINAELSGYEKSQVNGIMFGLGEEHAAAQVLRDGDWTDSEDDIIASIKKMPFEQRAQLRNDPEYIRRLGDLCDTDEDYRDAMNALMAGEGIGEGGATNHLAALDVASRDQRDIKGEANYEETDVVSHLCGLSEKEFRELLENPRLRAQVLAAVEGDKEEAQVRRILEFRFPKVAEETGAPTTAAAETGGLPRADRETLAFLTMISVEKLREGSARSWDELLRASIEVYNLDFEGEGAGSKPSEVTLLPEADDEPKATADTVDPTADKTASPRELRKSEGKKARYQVWRTARRATVKQINYDVHKQKKISDAVLHLKDPSTARLKENIGVLDDEEEIKESLRNASDEVLIDEWTSVVKYPARSGKRTMKSMWSEYKALRDAQPQAELDPEEEKAAEKAAEGEPSQDQPDVPSAEQQAAQMKAAGVMPAQPERDMPKAATPLSTKLLAFMNYTIDLSADFQRLLLPHAGSFLSGDNGSETLTTELDNTEWHEWADIIRDRIPRLPPNKIATALEIDPSDPDYGVISNPNRTAMTKAEFRRQKYLRQAGSNYDKNRFAQADHENMDMAMTRYGRALAVDQTDKEGGWGVISKEEERHLEEEYGGKLDEAIAGYKEAKAKIAMWASVIVGVIVTAAITILTAGVATGPAAMIMMAALTGAASAGASALTKEAIMQGDFGSDQALNEVATGAIMGAITAGSAYYAQNIFRSVAGLSSAAQAAKAVGNAPAPGMFRTLAMEAGEEIVSEGLTFGAESMLVLLDPNTWSEGWSEGRRHAEAEIGEKLAQAPKNMLMATLAVMATGVASKLTPGQKGPPTDIANPKRQIDPKANAIAFIRDQPSALVEGGVTLLLDKAFEGDFNIEDLPADMLMAYLEESKEGAMMAHNATAHAGTARDWVKRNLDKHRDKLTREEQADYVAMHQVDVDSQTLSFTGGDEAGTSIRLSVEQYIKFRQVAALQAAQRWQSETGEVLTKAEVSAFVDFLRSSRDSQEFAQRMKMDPKLVGAVHKIESDRAKIDQADADAVGLPNDKTGGKSEPRAVSAADDVTGYRTAEQTEAGKERTDKALSAMDSADLSDAKSVIAAAENAGQKTLIEKAIAAGNSIADVRVLAQAMDGYTTTFVLRNFSGMGIFQRYQQSCVPTAYQIARADIDPVYAMRLHDNPQLILDEQRSAVRDAGGATTKRHDIASGKDVPQNVKDGLVDSRVRKGLEDEEYSGEGSHGGIDMTDMVGSDMHAGFEKAAGTDYDVLTNQALPFENAGQGTFEQGTIPHDRIRAAVESGLPVIISMLNHAQVISGIVVENGVEKYVVHDPMSATTSLLTPDMFDALPTQSITIPSVGGKRADTTPTRSTDVDVKVDQEGAKTGGKVDPTKETTEPLSKTELALLTDIDNKVTELALENASSDEASKAERAAAETALSDLITRLGLEKMSPEERARRLEKLGNRARNFVVVRSDTRRREAYREGAGEHGRVEVHNHFMGIAGPEVFISRVGKHEGQKAGNEGKGNWELTLDAIASLPGLDHSVDEEGNVKRGISGDALNLVRAAQEQIRILREKGEAAGDIDDAAINELAMAAVRKALIATSETDFNSSYEVRDELIKKYFGKTTETDETTGKLKPDFSLVNDAERAAAADGARRTAGKDEGKQKAAVDKADAALTAYADYAREAIAVLVEEGQNYTEQSQSLNKLLRSFPRPMLQRLVDEAVAPKLKKINDDLAAGKITAEEAQTRRDGVRLVFRNLAMIPTGLFAPTDAKGKREFEKRAGKKDMRPELSSEDQATLEAEDATLRKDMREREDGARVEEPAELAEHGDEFIKQQEKFGLFDELERGDTTGIDIAGLEEFEFNAAGRARFRALYRKLADVSESRDGPVVLRPHVGEGSLDLEDTSKGHGIDNAARQGDRGTDGELAHYNRARHNVDALIGSLEELAAMGELDTSKVEVRFGHSTHATPDQIVRLRALGVIAEINLESNIQTHSLDPTNPETGKVEEGRFDDHALLSLIYYQTNMILSTDAHSVMSTNLAQEYAKAHKLIEAFLFGQLPLRVRTDEAGGRGREIVMGEGTSTAETMSELRVGDLTSAELDRFLNAYQSIMDYAGDYRDKAVSREDSNEAKRKAEKDKSQESTKTGGVDPSSATELADINRTIRERYASELAPQELVGPAEGAPVLEQNPDDALIGLSTDVIGSEGSFEEATAALQESGIPRYQQLTPEERKHEEAFIAEVEADMPTSVEKNYAMAYSSDQDTYIFEVDAAKRLYSEYGAGGKAKSDAETSVRLTANHAMHPTAVAVTRLAFLKRLDQLSGLKDGDPKKSVFVTNGGCAAGKGSLTGLVEQETGSFSFGAVWDAAGEGDAQENGWILAAAQARGLKVTFGMVENDPIKQYESVLHRAQGKGRIVDPVTFARSYVNGQKNFRAFLESPEYKAAQAAGTAEAFGMYTGAFNRKSLTDPNESPYPDVRLLGDNGQLAGAKDLAEPADVNEAVNAALALLDTWRAEQEAEGNDVSEYFVGAIVNALKFGASTDQDVPNPSPVADKRETDKKKASTKTGGGNPITTEHASSEVNSDVTGRRDANGVTTEQDTSNDEALVAEVDALASSLPVDAVEEGGASERLDGLLKGLGVVRAGTEKFVGLLQRVSVSARNYLVIWMDRRRRHSTRRGLGDHAQIELHNHFMGVASNDVFMKRVRDVKVGEDPANGERNEWVLLCEAILEQEEVENHAPSGKLGHKMAPDGQTIEKRGASGDAMELVRSALKAVKPKEARARQLREQLKEGTGDTAQIERKLDETLAEIEQIAKEAANRALAASDHTDFNSAYEVRDELVKTYFDGGSGDTAAAYADYAREAIRVLLAEGQLYSEQSNSFNKLKKRFPEKVLKDILTEVIAEREAAIAAQLERGEITEAEAKVLRQNNRLVMRQLGLIPTTLFAKGLDDKEHHAADKLAGDMEAYRRGEIDEVSEPAELAAHGNEFIDTQKAGIDEAMARQDAAGIDIAGMETDDFTEGGKARFRALYRHLKQKGKKGAPVVLRPHVGEGSLDLEDQSKGFGPENAQRNDEGQLAHYKRAHDNMEMLVQALEELQAMGQLDPELVTVRFGHATHASPEQVARMKALGVIAEVNLGSNVRTWSIDQEGEGGEKFQDHAILTNIYYDVQSILSTDGHGVMSTDLAQEYKRAFDVIEQFLSGELVVRVRKDDAGGRGTEIDEKTAVLDRGQLSSDELQAFLHAYKRLHEMARDYLHDVSRQPRTDLLPSSDE